MLRCSWERTSSFLRALIKDVDSEISTFTPVYSKYLQSATQIHLPLGSLSFEGGSLMSVIFKTSII